MITKEDNINLTGNVYSINNKTNEVTDNTNKREVEDSGYNNVNYAEDVLELTNQNQSNDDKLH